MQDQVQGALRRGLKYLAEKQLSSGEFVTLVAKDADIIQDAVYDGSPFTTSHILSSLLEFSAPESAEMIAKGVKFLTESELEGGIWRFWNKEHPGHENTPPDVDATACIRHILRLTTHKNAADPYEGILFGNRNQKGLFYTWIVKRWRHIFSPSSKGALRIVHSSPERLKSFFTIGQVTAEDIDVVVNANALLYLGDRSSTKRAAAWIRHVIETGQEETSDRFYQSKIALYYAVMRCTSAGVKSMAELRPLVLKNLRPLRAADGSYGGNCQDTALAANVLCFWEPDAPETFETLQHLLLTQREDGSWPAHAFYYGGWKRVRAWGSPELTTGFCLEALGRYYQETK